MRALYASYWTEYERGWGERPDGVTLFKDKPTGEARLAAFWEKRKAETDHVPEEYDVMGDLKLVEVCEEVYQACLTKDELYLPRMSQSKLMDPAVIRD